VRDNGEKAAVVAFMLGIVLVVFYKLIIGILAVGIVLVFVCWNIALPSADVAKKAEGSVVPSDVVSSDPGFRAKEHPPEEPPVI
jgi:hypothetical protein